MRFIDRLKFLVTNRYPNEDRCIPAETGYPVPKDIHSILYHPSGFSLTVFPATGGVVVQINGSENRHYERSLYVLPDSDDTVNQIAKIITLELFRK